MQTPLSPHPGRNHSSVEERLQDALENASHYLPAQGPIGVFIHHNTLHAFQHLPFEEAVTKAADMFQTEPFLSEEDYQAQRLCGRLLPEDIDAVLAREPNALVIPEKLNRRQLRRALLVPGVRQVNGRNILWQIEEGGLLASFRADLDPTASRALASDNPSNLWEACCERIRECGILTSRQPRRPGEALLHLPDPIELDLVVHPPLIRLTGAFLDQGIAYWPMPLREHGLLEASRQIMGRQAGISLKHLAGIPSELRRQEAASLTPVATVLEMLQRLGIAEDRWEAYLEAELLALPGWAGMIACLEKDPSLAPHERVRASLMEFMALRLTYTTVALEDILGDARSWQSLSPKPLSQNLQVRRARLFDAAQLLGLNSVTLYELPEDVFENFCRELESFHNVERRRILHLAYERRHERQVLIPLSKHRSSPLPDPAVDRTSAQVLFCIDEREESMRRALEEVDPTIETHGAAGFFGCAIDYAGIDDATAVALCPVVVKPGHAVREKPLEEDSRLFRKRQSARRLWARVVHEGGIASRTLVRGSLSTAILGLFNLFPMVVRLLSPLAYGKFISWLNTLFLPQPRTELQFMREDDLSRRATAQLQAGFSVEEMADRVASVLGPAGLRKGHARIVAVLGHGSTSINNPHESAYDCGACGGRRGGPNARVFTAMANRPEVRVALRQRDIFIPEDVWFVGGYHDTCSDEIQLFDLNLVPPSHLQDLERLRQSLDKARTLSAHERTRRFEAASSVDSPAGGLRHVQERAEHLGEARPEYGHGTNAVAIVGRRSSTRGLFLDRRAFLVSYDPGLDPEDRGLAAILGAVIPVCGGISLEYFFSSVDNEGYGCGTKLPHNITGLLGVMNGYQGDLRTGLPSQTVEIHEPVRILFVVESTPERVLAVIHASPLLKEFLENRWIRLATMDPDTGLIQVYRGDGSWEALEGAEEPLPVAESSMAYYSGKIDHLPIARIQKDLTRVA